MKWLYITKCNGNICLHQQPNIPFLLFLMKNAPRHMSSVPSLRYEDFGQDHTMFHIRLRPPPPPPPPPPPSLPPSLPEAVLPDRALYLPTFSHLLLDDMR